jgi:hypothetical protein
MRPREGSGTSNAGGPGRYSAGRETQSTASPRSTSSPDDRRPFADYCECRKPKGCWGTGTWHVSSVTEGAARSLAAREAEAEIRRESLRGEDAEIRQKMVLDRWLRYVGSQVAYERCPVIMRAIERHCAEIRRARAQEPDLPSGL